MNSEDSTEKNQRAIQIAHPAAIGVASVLAVFTAVNVALGWYTPALISGVSMLAFIGIDRLTAYAASRGGSDV